MLKRRRTRDLRTSVCVDGDHPTCGGTSISYDGSHPCPCLCHEPQQSHTLKIVADLRRSGIRPATAADLDRLTSWSTR